MASVRNINMFFQEGMAMRLSKREQEIIELVSYGCSDKEISRQLEISARTVQTHITRIVMKLNARNRTNAVATYLRQNAVVFA